MNKAVCLLLLAVLFVPVLGCDKATPVAPAGTTITVSANPTEITSVTGSSTVTAVVLREGGRPVNPGTQVRFETTLGTIDPVAETDSSGVARATLQGDGRLGTADVRASSGSVRTEPVKVTIGTAAKTIVLQATPTNLPSTGGKVSLVALVRDSRGQPLVNTGVNFLTELGSLGSGGGIRKTDANGRATDTLTISESDIDLTESTGFSVTAQTTAGDGALVSDDFHITVQSGKPRADFRVEGTGRNVKFVSTSTGEEPLTFDWDFGDGSAHSTDRNPSHLYATASTYTVVLEVTNSRGGDVATKRVEVSASGAPKIVP